jgi:hypothetical protein
LEFYGTVCKFNTLIASYLKDRYQKVAIDNRQTHNSTSSGCERVNHGVPQGSIPGPLFLLLYSNDLHNIAINKVKMILNAEDITTVASNPSFQDFNNNVNKVSVDKRKWFKTNLLSLH